MATPDAASARVLAESYEYIAKTFDRFARRERVMTALWLGIFAIMLAEYLLILDGLAAWFRLLTLGALIMLMFGYWSLARSHNEIADDFHERAAVAHRLASDLDGGPP